MVCVRQIQQEKPGGRVEVGIEVTLTGAEQIAVVIRDESHHGSWEKMKKWIKTKGSEDQRRDDLPRAEQLEHVEKIMDINLSDYINW